MRRATSLLLLSFAANLAACASIAIRPTFSSVTPPFWGAVDQGVVVVVAPAEEGVGLGVEGADNYTAFFYEASTSILRGRLGTFEVDLLPHAERLVAGLAERGAVVALGESAPNDGGAVARYRLEIGIAYRGLARRFLGPVPIGSKKVVAQVFLRLTERSAEKPLFAQSATRAARFDASGDYDDETLPMERAFAVAVDEAAAMVSERFLRWPGTRVSFADVAGFDAL